MTKTTRTIIAAMMLSASAYAQTAYRFIHNNDGTDILSNRWNGSRPSSVRDVQNYVDWIAEGGATTYVICSGSDVPGYLGSKFGPMMGDFPDSCISQSKEWQAYKQTMNALKAEGTDYVRVCLARAKEKGMEAIVSYRMNDLHFSDGDDPGAFMTPDFWRNNPKLKMKGVTYAWHSQGAYDFKYPEVRKRKLDMITEQLEMFEDMDGFEMDFCRFAIYFRPEESIEKAYLMTDMIRDIRARADSISAVRGHKLMLVARVPCTVESCIQKGLDVRTWVKEGLVDFLTLGVHWSGDPAIDADAFRADLGKECPRIPIYATIDDGGFYYREPFTMGMFRGMASFAYAHGADGVMLFNYFLEQYLKRGRTNTPQPGGLVCRQNSIELMQELGNPQALEGRNKSYAWCNTYEFLIHSKTPLPLSLPSQVNMPVGDKMKKGNKPEEVILFVRTDCKTDLTVTIKGQECKLMDHQTLVDYDRLRGVQPTDGQYAFLVPARAVRSGDNMFTITSSEPRVNVTRLELSVGYGDVAEHGYF